MWGSQFSIANVMQEYQISDPTLAYQLVVKQASEYTNIYRKIFGKPENKVKYKAIEELGTTIYSCSYF